jgi:hypothetical protein
MTVTNPQNGFNDALKGWEDAQNQYKIDLGTLQAAIQTMMQMVQSGNVQGALQYGEMNVMQDAMNLQGDNLNILGGAENLATSMRGFVTGTQNIFNEGSKLQTDNAGAVNFANWLNSMYQDVSSDTSPNGPWLDPTDQANMLTSLQAIYAAFGATPGQLNGNEVMTAAKNWFTNTGKNPPNQNITTVQNEFQSLNNSVSSLSTTATTMEQYWSNIFNQMQGLESDMFQSTSGVSTAANQNMAGG